MSDHDYKSVLAFYDIPGKSQFKMNFQAIWDDFIVPSPGIRCTNVFHFEMTPDELMLKMTNKDFSSELASDIHNEFESGASVVFVQPIKGAPVGGFFVHELLTE